MQVGNVDARARHTIVTIKVALSTTIVKPYQNRYDVIDEAALTVA